MLLQVFYSKSFLLFLLVTPTKNSSQGWGGECGFCGLLQTANRRAAEQRLSNIQKLGLEDPQTSEVTESSSIWCSNPQTTLLPVVLWLLLEHFSDGEHKAKWGGPVHGHIIKVIRKFLLKLNLSMPPCGPRLQSWFSHLAPQEENPSPIRVLQILEDDWIHTCFSAKHAQFNCAFMTWFWVPYHDILSLPTNTTGLSNKPHKKLKSGAEHTILNIIRTMENWMDYQFPGSRIYLSDDLGQVGSPVILPPQLKFRVNQKSPFRSPYTLLLCLPFMIWLCLSFPQCSTSPFRL